MKKKIDKPFFFSIVILAIAGFFIFSSASLEILARSEAKFTAIASNQFFFGLCLGFVALFVAMTIPHKFWKKWSLVIFIFSLILTVLVFVPGIGWEHGGAKRWIHFGSFNFQPSEALKIGYVMYLALWLSKHKSKLNHFAYGLIPFGVITGIAGILLLLQPDNDTLMITVLAGLSMYFAAGASKKDLLIIGLVGLVGIGGIIAMRPYVRERIKTFIHPSANSLSSGYQIQQSLIAIGSGGIFGKGFGQSTQKFSFLPEPIGDSIFAVASEEFGLLGSVLIILLFVFFAVRGLKIAVGASDDFGRLLTLGIVILIIAESFVNIAAMLGIFPLSGTPLLFISHGGTALFITLAEVGIILSISRHIKRT